MTDPNWREAIRSWLDSNPGTAPPGLSVEEARRKAQELASRFRLDRELPEGFLLDDSGKDVLYAVVELLEDPRRSFKERASLAERVADLLRERTWPGDTLGERDQLLRACDSIARSASMPPGAYPLPEPPVQVVADTPEDASGPSAHMDDAAMLRFATGEMTPEEKEIALRHLHSCDICSASAAAIAAFRTAREETPDSEP